jgi:hypothetical protein
MLLDPGGGGGGACIMLGGGTAADCHGGGWFMLGGICGIDMRLGGPTLPLLAPPLLHGGGWFIGGGIEPTPGGPIESVIARGGAGLSKREAAVARCPKRLLLPFLGGGGASPNSAIRDMY